MVKVQSAPLRSDNTLLQWFCFPSHHTVDNSDGDDHFGANMDRTSCLLLFRFRWQRSSFIIQLNFWNECSGGHVIHVFSISSDKKVPDVTISGNIVTSIYGLRKGLSLECAGGEYLWQASINIASCLLIPILAVTNRRLWSLLWNLGLL
ncbi:hypothetical protein DFS33DRAFT_888472 [Desarmillaria ectypa]|nr:hypothetical protein DFS33DRAFT_888472 [Desarmillaria ectypa]